MNGVGALELGVLALIAVAGGLSIRRLSQSWRSPGRINWLAVSAITAVAVAAIIAAYFVQTALRARLGLGSFEIALIVFVGIAAVAARWQYVRASKVDEPPLRVRAPASPASPVSSRPPQNLAAPIIALIVISPFVYCGTQDGCSCLRGWSLRSDGGVQRAAADVEDEDHAETAKRRDAEAEDERVRQEIAAEYLALAAAEQARLDALCDAREGEELRRAVKRMDGSTAVLVRKAANFVANDPQWGTTIGTFVGMCINRSGYAALAGPRGNIIGVWTLEDGWIDSD